MENLDKASLLEALDGVPKTHLLPKWQKILQKPFAYTLAILFRVTIYKWRKTEIRVEAATFFNRKMMLLLPSSTDIFLTGGKPHDSEVRLARYLIHQLNIGDIYFDIGAHYGYFSLLVDQLVGKSGKVVAFEAAPKTFEILVLNSVNSVIQPIQKAVSNSSKGLTFYEFPNLYSEYNSINVDQYKNEVWFSKNPPKRIEIESVMLDDFVNASSYIPKIIKVDVEGAELLVLKGAERLFKAHEPILVMEFLSTKRGNKAHVEASELLYSKAYKSYRINDDGTLKGVIDIPSYLAANGLESDNIVFARL